MIFHHLFIVAAAALSAAGGMVTPSPSDGRTPAGVIFHRDTLFRSDGEGDNWCITWAADDSQITSMDDGNWLSGEYGYHNHLYRILGGPEGFTREDIPNYPQFAAGKGSWFGYGIVSVDTLIYSVISKTPGGSWSGPFRGIKLLKSADNGASWFRIDRQGKELFLDVNDSMRNVVDESEMFFLEENGLPHNQQVAYPFSFVDFVQQGQAHSAAGDDYLYIYSPEGAHAHQLTLARAEKYNPGVRSEWEYFTKYDTERQPQWSDDITERGYIYQFPEKSIKGDYFGVAKDVTVKKIVEDRNKKLKELYEYIINHIYNTILVIQNRKIKFVNSSATVSGYEPEELTGKKVDSLVIEEDREKILKKMEEKLKGKGEGKPTHYRIKRKDGKIMKIEAISRKIEWEGKPALLTCISMIDNK